MCTAFCCTGTQAATVYFNRVYQGAGSNYSTSDGLLSGISPVAGSGFSFTSINPAAPNFVADAGGNDIRGVLSYVNSSGTVVKITGIISRLDKVNGAPEGFYFVDPINRKGYLLVVAGSESFYRTGIDVRTSSESSLLNSLNVTVTEQQAQPMLSITHATAVESAGFMVFTLAVNPAATGNFSFTPTLIAGSAAATADYTGGMQIKTGATWEPVSGLVQLTGAATTFQIRVPIVDDILIEGTETFVLSSGPINGGGFVNNQGAFGEATIVDNDGSQTPINHDDLTYVYGAAAFVLTPSSLNTTGAYSFSITGNGRVLAQSNDSFYVVGVGTTQITIYQAPGSGYGQGVKVVNVQITPAPLLVKANDKTKQYDGLPFSGGNGFTCTGWVYNETGAVLSGNVQYGGSAQSARDAGTYTISAGGLTAANYTISYADGSLVVTKAPLTIAAADEVRTYDGQRYSGGNGVVFTGLVNNETQAVLQGALAYGGSAQGAIDAGNYTITPSGYTAANYSISYTNGLLAIERAPLTVAALAQSKIYDGQLFNRSHGVSYSGFVGTDNETNALGGSLVYSGSWQQARAVGSYTVEPSGLVAANYLITYVDGVLVINPAILTVTVANKTKVYDGAVFSGGFTSTYQGFVAGETAATAVAGTLVYGGTAPAARNAGVYTISAGGLAAANYLVRYVPGTLTITRAPLTISVVNGSKTYDATAYSGGNGVRFTGLVNSETSAVLTGSPSYGGTAQGAINVGSYTLTAAGYTSANYNISYQPGVLTIVPALLTVTVNSHAKVYDGAAYQGGSGVVYSGFAGTDNPSVLGGSLVYGGTAQGARNVGSYVLSASGLVASNYTIVYVNGALAVHPAPLVVRAASQRKTYDGLAFNGTHSFSCAGFVGADNEQNTLVGTPQFAGTWPNATAAGVYTILPAALTAANYSITYEAGTLTIDRAPLTLVVADQSKTYDGQVFNPAGHRFSATGFVNGESANTVFQGQVVYGGTALSAIDAGTYTVNASGLAAANYDINYIAGILTIGKASLVAGVVPVSKTYDGQPFEGGNGVHYSGFVAGDDASVVSGSLAYSGNGQGAIQVGTYQLTASGLTAANYTIAYTPATLVIGPATLTAKPVAARKTYDGQPWQGGGGIIYKGFIPGESASVVQGDPIYGGAAQGARDAGTYGLTIGGLQAANYIFVYEAATLTIDPAPLSVRVDNVRKVYDGRPYTGRPEVSYEGFVAGDTPQVLAGVLQFAGSWAQAVNAGVYPVTAAGLQAANYSIRFVAGQLDIVKAPLLVRAASLSKKYNGKTFDAASFTVSYEGFVDGDALSELTGTLVFSGTALTAKDAGTYALMPGGLQAANYEPVFTAGTLTIEKVPLVVAAGNHLKTYDGQPFPLGRYTATLQGFVAGEDTTNAVKGVIRFSGTALSATDAGAYVIHPEGLYAANYEISYADGQLTIDKATPVLVLPDMVKTYGDPEFSLTAPKSSSTGTFSFRVDNPAVGRLAGSRVQVVGVGSATYTVVQAADRNHHAATATARLLVHPAILTVTAASFSRCVSDLNPTLSYTITGFVKGENASVLTGKPTLHTSATPDSPAGIYPITVAGGQAANYSFRYVHGRLQVNKPLRQPVELPLVAAVKGETVRLSARSFGVAYQWLPAAGLSTATSATTEVRVQHDQEFTVRITDHTGCAVTDRVKVRVFDQGGYYVPNAFTPDGDGHNDQLRVIGPGLEQLEYFRVFNRYGQLIFETRDPGRGWDGTFKGARQPEDTYVWVLMGRLKGGSKVAGKGFVVIVR